VHAPSLEWPGPPPKTRFAPVAAACLGVAAFVVAIYFFVQDWQRILDLRPVEVRVWANLPENGGWQGGPLRVESGHTVRLTVASVAGTHSFALAHTDVRSRKPLAAGEAETIEFTAPAPGRYVLYCTTWCSPNHWRMRTMLEVFDPAAPDAPLAYPQEPIRYQLALDQLSLDTIHQMAMPVDGVAPAAQPNARAGASIWQQLAPTQTPAALLAEIGWPVASAREVYDALSKGEVQSMKAAAAMSKSERWSLVAYLWQQSATPDTLARGAELFSQNCADCHGENGRGDGMAAPFSPAQEPDFADVQRAVTRSPAVYYAKIARGGMGTGMPNWGTILDEDDLWALTAYLHSFMFDYTPEE
jgi:mono/diheme cytochrome c family protein